MSDADSSRLLDADDGTDHDHDSGDEPLGEVDTRAWGAAALGAGISLLLVIALYVATQG
jgi:hypothetical protein